ncbi:uncharacterized protein [Hyperolius riggenbachi]|uniref:uncharacterized protein n=1 Tax=Hyperolius riggenbachi TaxID=752182 RepID=UPI0035A31C5D
MGQIPARYSENATEQFHQQMSQHDIDELRLIFDYFKSDLICMLTSIDTKRLLEELSSRIILDNEFYLEVKRDLGAFAFAEKLLQNIVDSGKGAIVRFSEILYVLQDDFCCSNFYTVQKEVNELGDNLLQQILLDTHGHSLSPELKEMQEQHKNCLLEKTIAKDRTTESAEENQHNYVPDRYMDMIISSVRPFHRRSQHKLIDTVIKHEHFLQGRQNDVAYISPKRLFCWTSHLKCVPHAAMVTGVPGIGKTTLLQKFVCKWVNGKLWQRFAFIFFFRFQDLNRIDNISVKSMILQEYPYLEDKLGDILQDPKKLLFIFDGLDESIHGIDFKAKRLCSAITKEASTGTIVVSLVRQSLLKGCSVLLTSRPDRLAAMDISVFKRILEIIGFLTKDKQTYFEKFFKNKILSDKAFSYVRQNSVLYAFCYIPSYCWIICTVLSACFTSQPTSDEQKMLSLPRTLTELFVSLVANILSMQNVDKATARNLLTSIGWMAEYGVMKRITRFDKQTLSLHKVDSTSTALSCFMKESQSSPKSYSFIHPITQEFFAALVHYINYSPEKLHESLEEATSHKDNRAQLFLSFLCGLSDISTRSVLEPYVGDLSSDTARDTATWIQKYVQTLETDDDISRTFLNVFFILFEMKDKDFALECLGSGRQFNFYSVHLTPLDCTLLAFVLESCRETEELSLSMCNLQIEHMEKLGPSLHTLCSLRVTDNRMIGNDGVQVICSALTHPECRIHTLWLSGIGLTDLACSYLGSAISNNQSLRILYLDYNSMEGPHFCDLMTALSSPTCKLEALHLQSTRLSDSSCPHLASAIRNNTSLKTLDISFNELIGPHFGDLMEALSSPTCIVENLLLRGILLRDEHLPLLMPLSNNKNLTRLELCHNYITSAGVRYIKELILKSPSLIELIMFLRNRLPDEDITALFELEAQKPGLRVRYLLSPQVYKMGQIPERYAENATEQFHQQMSQHDIDELRLIFEYFKSDLICMLMSIDTKRLLEEMSSRIILNSKFYLEVKRDLGAFAFADKLLQNIVDSGKGVIVRFSEIMYVLEMDFRCYNFYTVQQEVNELGDNLLQQIILDAHGHPLSSELKEMQEQHKNWLLEKTIAKDRTTESAEGNQHNYFPDRYMDMIISSVRPFHRRSQHKLIDTVIKHEYFLQGNQNDGAYISPKRFFCWTSHLKCVPHAVMVTGVPGIGKTTLLQNFVCKWVNGKLWQRFAFIFFFRFQDLNRFDNISVKSMILQGYPYLEDKLGDILQDPTKLLFIFDGLDESIHGIDFKAKGLCSSIIKEASTGTIVVSLVRQSLLKGCSVLLTSRPDRLAAMDIRVFRRILEIIGFLTEDKQMYFEEFFKNKILSDKAFSYVRQNSVLYAFCYIPSYCWIICTVLSACFKSQPTSDEQKMLSLPRTLTELFVALVANILSMQNVDKATARNLLTSIGWMAEYGVMKRITRFDKQTLSLHKVDSTSTALSCFMKESQSSPKSYSFIHPITQEFFAALVHYINYSPEKLHESLEEATSHKDNWAQLFLSFLCGLSDISTRSVLEPYVGDLSSDTARDTATWIQQYVQTLETDDDDISRTFLNVFFILFEMKDKDFALECLGSGRQFNFSSVHLTPLDCTSLAFVLESCRETEDLCLSMCNLQIEHMEKLGPSLHTLWSFRISENRMIGDDGVQVICSALTHPECRIHTLWLSRIGLTDLACSYLGSAVSNNQSLRILNLDNNNMEGPLFCDLMMALSSPTCKLEELHLQSTRLSDSSCPYLASAIRNNTSLKTLDISFNDLIGPHFGDLMEALSSPTCTVENLLLQSILLRDEHLPLLMPLSSNKNLTRLQLCYNDITSAGIRYIKDLILQSPSLIEFMYVRTYITCHRHRRDGDGRTLKEERGRAQAGQGECSTACNLQQIV